MPPFPAMELNRVYFFTASILNWQNLLCSRQYKQVIIDSLKYLSDRRKIKIYAFVIMPNHIHFLWEMLAKNGREMPYSSFMKHTGHLFLKMTEINTPHTLPHFYSTQADRKYHFWERNSLPVHLYSKSVVEQKLAYIHQNPIAGRWKLAQNAVEYPYSSAKFYAGAGDDFGFLVDYRERFG